MESLARMMAPWVAVATSLEHLNLDGCVHCSPPMMTNSLNWDLWPVRIYTGLIFISPRKKVNDLRFFDRQGGRRDRFPPETRWHSLVMGIHSLSSALPPWALHILDLAPTSAPDAAAESYGSHSSLQFQGHSGLQALRQHQHHLLFGVFLEQSHFKKHFLKGKKRNMQKRSYVAHRNSSTPGSLYTPNLLYANFL